MGAPHDPGDEDDDEPRTLVANKKDVLGTTVPSAPPASASASEPPPSDDPSERTLMVPAPNVGQLGATTPARPIVAASLASTAPGPMAARPDPSAAAAAIVRGHALFRRESLEAHLAAARDADVLRVAPPWSRAVFWLASSVVATAIALAFVFDVEHTGFARGILRVAGGVQTVSAQAAGVVQDVGPRSGEVIDAGRLLVRIDSAQTRAALVESERQIELAEQKLKEFDVRKEKIHSERVRLLEQRAGLLGRRVGNQEEAVHRLQRKLDKFSTLTKEGLTSELERNNVEEEMTAAQRESLRLREELTQTRLQITSIAVELDTERSRLAADIQQSKDKREALAVQLTQTEVRAPRGGRIEALLVKNGDALAVGAPIAKLVPTDAPRQVVVFVPERDRAFLSEGAEGRIEVDQLPVGEFGALRGKVSRIASDLASQAEIVEAIGDAKVGEPVFRVELTLEQNESLARLEQLLRPGSLVTARFALRKRRIITVLFEPLHRFFA